MPEHAIHQAMRVLQIERVRALLDEGAPIDDVDRIRSTLLHAAAEHAPIEYTTLFVSRGARLDLRDFDGRTPLELAAVRGRLEQVIALLDAAASRDAAAEPGALERDAIAEVVEEARALGVVATIGALVDAECWELVARLVEAGLELPEPARFAPVGRPDYRFRFHQQAPDEIRDRVARATRELAMTLEMAARYGPVSAVEILLARGAQPDAKGLLDTPMNAACERQHDPRVLDRLRAAGAQLEARQIMVAVIRGNVHALRWMHGAGVALGEPALLGKEQQTPLAYAIREAQLEVVALFTELGLGGAEATREAAKAAKAKAALAAKTADAAAKAQQARARREQKVLATRAAPPMIPPALARELARLGFSIEPTPRIDADALKLAERNRWLAYVTPPPTAFRDGDRLRVIRFGVPFEIGRSDHSVQLVIGQTPGHFLTIESAFDGAAQIVRGSATSRSVSSPGKLRELLARLVPDTGAPPVSAVADAAVLSPALDASVRASFAMDDVFDIAAGAVSLTRLAQLEMLYVHHADVLCELDARFASLETLVVRGAVLGDLAPLARLPALRRLMLHGCAIERTAPLAQLSKLTELHLPHCLLTAEQLAFVSSMSLECVTVTGNRLGMADRDFVASLPHGLDPDGSSAASLAFTDRVVALGIDGAGLVRGPRHTVTVRSLGRPQFAPIPPPMDDGAIRYAATRGVPVTDEPEALAAWPRAKRMDPVARHFVPDAVFAQLDRLGVEIDAELDASDFATATTQLLARLRWPEGTSYRARSSALTIADFAPTELHVLDVGGKRRLTTLGLYDSHAMVLLVSGGDDPDPHVYAVDVEDPDAAWWGRRHPLSAFLASLAPKGAAARRDRTPKHPSRAKATKLAGGVKVPAAIAKELQRLGITLADAPSALLPRAFADARLGWLAHLERAPLVMRGRLETRGRAYDLRDFQLCAPFEWTPGELVIGLTPISAIVLRLADQVVGEVAAPGATVRGRRRKLDGFLRNLEVDPAVAIRPPSGTPVALSPHLAAHVLWSLAETGVLDLAPHAIGAGDVAKLRLLRIGSLRDARELDARFESLSSLELLASTIDAASALEDLAQLERLRLSRCMILNRSALRWRALAELVVEEEDDELRPWHAARGMRAHDHLMLDALEQLGVTFDATVDVHALPSLMLRRLGQARWPEHVRYRSGRYPLPMHGLAMHAARMLVAGDAPLRDPCIGGTESPFLSLCVGHREGGGAAVLRVIDRSSPLHTEVGQRDLAGFLAELRPG